MDFTYEKHWMWILQVFPINNHKTKAGMHENQALLSEDITVQVELAT